MDINEMTIGQAKELASMFGNGGGEHGQSRGHQGRAIVVVDRGWIFAGDVSDANGRVRIDNAVWVFRWESVGFSGIVADPSKADLRKMDAPVDLPAGAEVFRVPVPESWGASV